MKGVKVPFKIRKKGKTFEMEKLCAPLDCPKLDCTSLSFYFKYH